VSSSSSASRDGIFGGLGELVGSARLEQIEAVVPEPGAELGRVAVDVHQEHVRPGPPYSCTASSSTSPTTVTSSMSSNGTANPRRTSVWSSRMERIIAGPAPAP
jgi:hypothetical protein